jgi:hypothetical protein
MSLTGWIFAGVIPEKYPLCYHAGMFPALFLFENNMKKMMSTIKPAGWLAAADIRLGEFQSAVDEATRVDHLWRRIAPAWARGETVPGRVRDGVLPVYCRSAVVAGKLRQSSLRLAAELARAGLSVSLAIKVDVGQLLPMPPKSAQRVLSAQALTTLDNLHADLPEGSLKLALAHLLLHQRNVAS